MPPKRNKKRKCKTVEEEDSDCQEFVPSNLTVEQLKELDEKLLAREKDNIRLYDKSYPSSFTRTGSCRSPRRG